MTTQTHSDSPNGISSVLWALGLIGVATTAAGFAWFGWAAGVSVALGALLAAGNLWVLAKLVNSFLDPNAARRPMVLVALVKFTALFGGVFALLQLGVVHIPALAVGYAALPLGIVLGQFKTPPARAREGS